MAFQIVKLLEAPITVGKVARKGRVMLPNVNSQMSSKSKLLVTMTALEFKLLLSVNGLLMTSQMVHVLERQTTILFFALERSIFSRFLRMFVFLVAERFLLCQKL